MYCLEIKSSINYLNANAVAGPKYAWQYLKLGI